LLSSGKNKSGDYVDLTLKKVEDNKVVARQKMSGFTDSQKRPYNGDIPKPPITFWVTREQPGVKVTCSPQLRVPKKTDRD